MATEPQQLAQFVATETGLACDVHDGIDSRGDPWYLVQPAGAPSDHAFAVRVTVRWRRIVVAFEPGRFAGDLLAAMGNADPTGRAAFRAILAECSNRGADIAFRLNDVQCDPQKEETWPPHWSRLSLTLSSRIDAEVREGEHGFEDTLQWSRLFVAAVVALLPPSPSRRRGIFSRSRFRRRRCDHTAVNPLRTRPAKPSRSNRDLGLQMPSLWAKFR